MVEYCMFIISVFKRHHHVFLIFNFLPMKQTNSTRPIKAYFIFLLLIALKKTKTIVYIDYFVLICLWFFVILHSSDSRFSVLNTFMIVCPYMNCTCCTEASDIRLYFTPGFYSGSSRSIFTFLDSVLWTIVCGFIIAFSVCFSSVYDLC